MPSSSLAYAGAGTPTTGNASRPSSATNGANSPTEAAALEATSRAAAEEDKRRRNTAASARFRVKKKQREQALERTAKEMTDRAERLEARITELEQENKFLRSLVVEKAAPSAPAISGLKSAQAKDEQHGAAAEVLRKVAADARKPDSAKKGVGTVAE